MAERMGAPPWVVTVVCGAAGVGKTRVAVALAARYGVPLAEADDVITAVRALTTSEHLPAVHYWDAHPEAGSWPAERIAAVHFMVADALRPGLHAVIADHLEYDAPVVIEGDYLTPALAAGHDGRVRALVVTEPDQDQLIANFAAREPERGPQRHRAAVSVLVGARLQAQAAAIGVPAVPARPWHDSPHRADHALRTTRPPT